MPDEPPPATALQSLFPELNPTPSYAPFYCEENIWHLAGHPMLTTLPRWVVFISNPGKSCAMWSQRASMEIAEPVVWDYHVVLLVEAPEHGRLVFDLDTHAPCPCRLSEYLHVSFPYRNRIPQEFEPQFRLIEADTFRVEFRSDRHHMQTEEGWKAAPPPWPCIGSCDSSNLFDFIDVTQSFFGVVTNCEGLLSQNRP